MVKLEIKKILEYNQPFIQRMNLTPKSSTFHSKRSWIKRSFIHICNFQLVYFYMLFAVFRQTDFLASMTHHYEESP